MTLPVHPSTLSGWGPPAGTPGFGARMDQLMRSTFPGAGRDRELGIHGEVREKERKGVVRRRTRRAGRFDHRMSLPSNVDTERITAELVHGVLTVRVPKAEKAGPQRIEITG